MTATQSHRRHASGPPRGASMRGSKKVPSQGASKPPRSADARTSRPDARYRFVQPHRARTTMVVVMLTAITAGVAMGTLTMSQSPARGAVLLGAAAACAVTTWGLLMAWTPQVVTVDGSLIVIKRGSRTEQFDLVDPNVVIQVRDGEIAFTHYDGRWVTLRSADVDWKVFTDVVMYYQNHADRKAEERTERWLL